MQLLVRFKQHDRARTYLRWLLLLFFAMPHTKTYKKYQLGRSSIYDLSKNICPTTRRNIPVLRFVSRRQPQPPRRRRRILGARGWTALHYAAQKGHAPLVEQLISAGAKVDATRNDGRGPGRVFGSFWEWLWRADGRGSYMGRWFSFFALGCWVVSVLVV